MDSSVNMTIYVPFGSIYISQSETEWVPVFVMCLVLETVGPVFVMCLVLETVGPVFVMCLVFESVGPCVCDVSCI